MITQCGRNSSNIASQSSFLLSSSSMFSISNTKGGGVGGGNGGMRAGTGGCYNKTVEKPLRRKWILEKWLIWITLLVASILLDCKFGLLKLIFIKVDQLRATCNVWNYWNCWDIIHMLFHNNYTIFNIFVILLWYFVSESPKLSQ